MVPDALGDHLHLVEHLAQGCCPCRSPPPPRGCASDARSRSSPGRRCRRDRRRSQRAHRSVTTEARHLHYAARDDSRLGVVAETEAITHARRPRAITFLRAPAELGAIRIAMGVDAEAPAREGPAAPRQRTPGPRSRPRLWRAGRVRPPPRGWARSARTPGAAPRTSMRIWLGVRKVSISRPLLAVTSGTVPARASLEQHGHRAHELRRHAAHDPSWRLRPPWTSRRSPRARATSSTPGR